MERKTLTCICCPIGCTIEAELEGNHVFERARQLLSKGRKVRKIGTFDPCAHADQHRWGSRKRNGAAVAPVRSAREIPKGKMLDCMKELSRVSVAAPVHIGDIALKNAAGTGVDIVITRDMQ